MARALSWGLPLLTLAVYLWLVLGHGLALQAMAGGLPPFDLRISGYDLAQARAYLAALPPEGYALYLGPIARLDTVFPILMGLTLIWWMRPWGRAFGSVAVTVALAYVALDLLENRATAALFAEGALGIDAAQVRAASTLTQAKFMAFALAAVLAARASWVRWRSPQAGGPQTGGPQAGGTSQT
jgi:hypothetical protein